MLLTQRPFVSSIMGRRGGHAHKRPRTLARDFKTPRADVWEPGSGSERPGIAAQAQGVGQVNWSLTTDEMNNESFEAYYKAQKIVPEGEWEAFMQSLRTPLPATFRIAGAGKHAAAVLSTLRTDFVNVIASLGSAEAGSEEPPKPPVPLPWYPGELAWQMNYSRTQLRRLPELAKLHEWLVQGNLYGSINRQEAVSMVPPLFLDVLPHHVVLDMCAAPGSKTSQLLEALHAPVSGGEAAPANGLPTGCVVANDADLARCNMLTHQLKRAASPALIVINHDAGRLPAPRHPATGEALSYDRILADVPCTGDGTMRKAPDLWRKWHLHMAVGIHPLQLSIATRGAAMLRTGGRMVYSTCSLNPLEDEAVVAALLRETKGALRLVDTTGMLAALRRSAGKSHWLVLDKSGERNTTVPPPGSKGLKTLVQSMWPPATKEEADAMALHRCMRFLPHHGDTGGFFVAVLEKVSDWPLPGEKPAAGETAVVAGEAAGAEEDAPEEDDEEEAGAAVDAPAPDEVAAAPDAGPAPEVKQHTGNTSKQRREQRNAIDPVTAVTDEWILSTLQSFYGFGPSFPLAGMLYMRLGDVEQSREAGFTGRPKRLYAVASGAAAVLAGDTKRRLKVMSAGVKLFEKGHDTASKAVCPYRISQEGLHWVLPHMTSQVVSIHLHQLARLVRRRMLFFETPSHAGEAPPMLDAPSIAALATLAQGCIVILPLLPPGCGAGADTTPEDLAVVAWKGSVSVALLVNKQESPILLARLDALCDPQEVAQQKAEAALAESTKRVKATPAAAATATEEPAAAMAPGDE